MDRNELRKAIAAHPQWPAIREAEGLKIEKLTMAELRAVAVRLSIPGADDDSTHTNADGWSVGDTCPKCGTGHAVLKQGKFGEFLACDAFPKCRHIFKGKPDHGETDTAAKAEAQPVKNLFGETTTAQPEAVKDKAQKAVQLMRLLSELGGQQIDHGTVAKIVDEKLAEAMAKIPSVNVTLTRHDGSKHVTTGYHHPLYPELLQVLACRDASGYPLNIWIAGPAGSGKTHAAHCAAEALGLPFYMQGSLSMPHQLEGFRDAQGNYADTPFVAAYRNGGVILVDEVDRGDNSALLVLNAALANGHMSLPNGELLKRHVDCHIIAAGNTYGGGATADYIGAAKLDGAFLSRFPVKFSWDYDVALEQAICGNKDWAIRVQSARARARAAGLKVIIDPRHSIAGAALLANEHFAKNPKRVAELTYLAGLTPDQRKIVEGA